jgi:uncharacterized protein VirK/YbjX
MSTDLTKIDSNLDSLRCILHAVWYSKAIDFKNKCRLTLRIFIYLKSCLLLYQHYQQTPLAFVLDRFPRKYYKFHHPYLYSVASQQEKIDFSIGHAQFLSSLSLDFCTKIYDAGDILIDFSSVGLDISLMISHSEQFEKEGEITISLIDDADKKRIFSLTGAFFNGGFYIGGLQGRSNAEEQFKHFTKTTFGMRPHNMIAFCTMAICQSLSIDRIYGVTNKTHIYQSKENTKQRVQFDYNVFWTELQAELDESQHWFVLKTQYPQKDLSLIPSKKRSQYKKRYLLLDSIKTEIHDKIQKDWLR